MGVWTLLTILWTFLGVRVGQDYDPQTDFSRYKIFDWALVSGQKTSTPIVDDPFFNRRVQAAIENFLIQNGYVKASVGNPDFLIETHLLVERRVAVDRTGDGWPGNRYFGDSFFDTTVDEYNDGTLIIDFLAADTKGLLWRGTGSRRVDNASSPQQSVETINRWVAEILKQYPPKAKTGRPAPAGCSAPIRQAAPPAPQT
ncbi:MAG: DUF4136 domain-containing protein [Desulfobacterales bacterium]